MTEAIYYENGLNGLNPIMHHVPEIQGQLKSPINILPFEQLEAAIQGALFACDDDGRVLYVNREAALLFDAAPGEFVSQSTEEILPPEFCALLKRCRSIEQPHREPGFCFTNMYGRQIVADVQLAPLGNSPGLFCHIVCPESKSVEQNETDRMRWIVNQSPISVIVTNIQGVIEYVNPHFEKVTGYKSSEVIGKSTSILKSGYHPSPLYDLMWRTLMSKNEWRGDLLNKKKNGGVFWERTRIHPVLDGDTIVRFIAFKEDITEMRWAQEVLEETEFRYQALYHAMQEQVMIHEMVYDQNEAVDYQIVDVNQAFTQITGFKRDEVINQAASALYQASPPPFLDVYVETLSTQQPTHFEAYYPSLEKFYSISVFAINHTQFATISMDITDRVHSEKALHQLLDEKVVLLKEVHHRVKNNFQIVSSLLNMQSYKIQDSEAKRLIHESHMRIRTMAHIHQKLYEAPDPSKISALEYLEKLAYDIYRSYEGAERGIAFKFVCDAFPLPLDKAIPCGIILNELVSNSFKYAFVDGMKDGEVKISISLTNGDVCFHIADNGVGMDSLPPSSERDSLGLNLVHLIVEKQLNGSVAVDTASGMQFKIQFPIES